MKGTFLTVLICLALSVAGCSKHDDAENKKQVIVVYAASSLQNILMEITTEFAQKHPVEFQVNFASSGTLARQLAQGANADLYLSAHPKWVQYIDSLGIVYDGKVKKVAENSLVLITSKNSSVNSVPVDSAFDLSGLLHSGRLSMGNPAHVPAGSYAKAALEYYGWYDQINSHILPAKDVRAALLMVELEEAPLGIVYASDAMMSSKAKVLATLPKVSHPSIDYMVAVCDSDARVDAKAIMFYEFLNSKPASAIWRRHGFK